MKYLKSKTVPADPNDHGARNKAGITDLRFYDFRHEVASRFFEMGISVPEVALISGHKDVRHLFRYNHLNPENVLEKHEAF